MKVTVYRDKSGEYCWKLAAENGEIVADSAEGCKLKATQGAKHASCSVMRSSLSKARPRVDAQPLSARRLRRRTGGASVWAQGRGCAQTCALKGCAQRCAPSRIPEVVGSNRFGFLLLSPALRK